MQMAMTIVYSIIGISAIAAIYVGLGGRAIFGTREKPRKILGATILLLYPEGIGPKSPELLKGVVKTFEKGAYLVEFCEPYEINGRKEHFVTIQARHCGYPVSSIKKPRWWTWCPTGVNAFLESGAGFIASAVKG